MWGQFFIREAINDAYRPHSREEIENLVAKGQMSPEVASRLDPDKRYGIWWFNRRRIKTHHEAVNGPDGKRRQALQEAREDDVEAGGGVDSGVRTRLGYSARVD